MKGNFKIPSLYRRRHKKTNAILFGVTVLLVVLYVANDGKLNNITQNTDEADEMIDLWIKETRPSFCLDLIKGENVLVKDINMRGNNPFSMEVYKENDIVSDNIIKHGFWDKYKFNLFKKIMVDYSKEKDIPLHELTFVDIGSNIGWFTLSMASLGVQVMAFEPMTSNADMIKRSLCMKRNVKSGLSQRVQLFKNGLGTKEQTCYIISGDNNEGDGLVDCAHEKESDVKVSKDYSIRGKIVTKRLDDIASTKGKIIPLVKMDVEGFESHVVEGGIDFLLNSKIPFIISEFLPSWINSRDGGDAERMMTSFYDAGYKVQKFNFFFKKNGHLTREEAMVMEQYSFKNEPIFELVEEDKVE